MSASGYSKKEIRRAGETLLDDEASAEERESAEAAVNYWRTIHCEPLQRAFRDIQAILDSSSRFAAAGRVKKLPTIIDKLRRLESDNLATLYDIAGCRVIVPDMRGLREVCRFIEALPYFDSGKSVRRDYIGRPKSSGYRGRHLILAYDDLASGHKLFVEVQVRTEPQHAWATAVEMHDRAVKTRLKFDENDVAETDAAEFFVRMSKAIRGLEDSGHGVGKRVPGSRSFPDGARRIRTTLEEACNAIFLVEDDLFCGPDMYYLVELNTETQTAEVKPVAPEGAVDAYFRAERGLGGDFDVVLLGGASLDRLKRLYPNYFGDISMFVDLMGACFGASA